MESILGKHFYKFFFIRSCRQVSKRKKKKKKKKKERKNKGSADDSESTKVNILDDFWILDERINLNTNTYILYFNIYLFKKGIGL